MSNVKDFLFVDAVSGRPVERETTATATRVERRGRKSALLAILAGLIGLIALLATWAFS